MAVEIDVKMPEGGVITLGPRELDVFSAINQVFPGSKLESYKIRGREYRLLRVVPKSTETH